MEYTLDGGSFGINYLNAPYALLVEAFGNDGDNPRDRYKSEAQWDENRGSDSFWEVYDYKIGKSYNGADGLSREEITRWHLQASDTGMEILRAKLDAAVRRLTVTEFVAEMSELPTVVDELRADYADYSAEISELGDGSEVHIGAKDADGFFVRGGLEINLAYGVWVTVPDGDGQGNEIRGQLSDDEIRKAIALLTAYLVIKDES
jgi:hypothetical protein